MVDPVTGSCQLCRLFHLFFPFFLTEFLCVGDFSCRRVVRRRPVGGAAGGNIWETADPFALAAFINVSSAGSGKGEWESVFGGPYTTVVYINPFVTF